MRVAVLTLDVAASLALVVVAAIGCDRVAEPVATSTDVMESFTGELEVRVVDHVDGRSELRHYLRQAGSNGGSDTVRRLDFDVPPALEPGSLVELWGRKTGGRHLEVDRLAPLARGSDDRNGPSLGTGQNVNARALVAAGPLPKLRIAFVLVDLGKGVNLTVEQARQKAFGMAPGDRSMKQVVLEHSFGRQDIDGEVLGPFPATLTTDCDEDALSASLKSKVPAGFTNVVWYFGQRVSTCGWGGLAPLGRPERPGKELWLNGTASCAIASHEFGHNLGLQHASRLKCGAASFAETPTGACTWDDYGDTADVMGGGFTECYHFGGYSKAYLGWLEKCNTVEARESGTFTLLPLESPCNGLQALQVAAPKARTLGSRMLRQYYFELRAPVGLDAHLPPQVLVHVGSKIVSTATGRPIAVLDMKPGTTALDGLGAGEMFQDPAGGVRVRVESINAQRAVVKVEVDTPETPGPPLCLDGTTFVPPGADTCGIDGAPAPTPPPPAIDAGGDTAIRDAGAVVDAGPKTDSSPDVAATGTGGASGAGGGGGRGVGGNAGAGMGTGGAGALAPTTPVPMVVGGAGCSVGPQRVNADNGSLGMLCGHVGLLLGWLVLRARRRSRRQPSAPPNRSDSQNEGRAAARLHF